MAHIEVSVITPVRNGGAYVKNAVLSVEKQAYPCEHIIIDDFSEDNTWDILLQLSRGRPWIKLIKLEERTGPIGARNVGIKNSEGRYIAFLDADDIWLPRKLKSQISFMRDNGYVFTFTDYKCVTCNQDKIGRRVHGLNKITWSLHHMTRFIACSSVVLDRFYFKDFIIRDVLPAKRGEDFLAWSDCLLKCKEAVRFPNTLLLYTIMRNSRSSSKLSGAFSMFIIYNKIEGISVLKSCAYLFVYGVFSCVKMLWQKPNKPYDLKNVFG